MMMVIFMLKHKYTIVTSSSRISYENDKSYVYPIVYLCIVLITVFWKTWYKYSDYSNFSNMFS